MSYEICTTSIRVWFRAEIQLTTFPRCYFVRRRNPSGTKAQLMRFLFLFSDSNLPVENALFWFVFYGFQARSSTSYFDSRIGSFGCVRHLHLPILTATLVTTTITFVGSSICSVRVYVFITVSRFYFRPTEHARPIFIRVRKPPAAR